MNVIRRDPCVYCGTTVDKRTIDHIFPKSKNGPNAWYNYAPACHSCNQKKGNLSVLEMLMGAKKNILDTHLTYVGRDIQLPEFWFDPLKVKRS